MITYSDSTHRWTYLRCRVAGMYPWKRSHRRVSAPLGIVIIRNKSFEHIHWRQIHDIGAPLHFELNARHETIFDDSFWEMCVYLQRDAVLYTCICVMLNVKMCVSLRSHFMTRDNVSECNMLSCGNTGYGFLGAERLGRTYIFDNVLLIIQMRRNKGTKWTMLSRHHTTLLDDSLNNLTIVHHRSNFSHKHNLLSHDTHIEQWIEKTDTIYKE